MAEKAPILGRRRRTPTDWAPDLSEAPTAPIRLRGRKRAGGMAVVGVAMILVAVGIVANLFIYKYDAKAHAASLSEQLAQKMAAADKGGRCSAPPPSAATPAQEPRMLLSIPRIGLVAPVLDGTADHTLDLGIGHVSASTWPDQAGTDVLAAHNATFFVRLPDLGSGDTITLSAPCRRWTYRVSSQQVVTDTTTVTTSTESKLVLVTCWPITALFNTDQRYMLTADLVSADNDVTQISAGPLGAGTAPTWTPALPSGLAGDNLSNNATGIATGRLTTAGTPSPAWQSSPAPLNAVGAAVELFGGAIRTARAQHPSWWRTLAPGVPASVLAPLLDAPTKITFRSPLDLTVTANGDLLSRVDMTTTAQVGSGTYRIDAAATPNGSRLRLSSWTMTLIAGRAPSPPRPAPRQVTVTAPARTSAAAPATSATATATTSTSTPATTASTSPSPASSSPSLPDPSASPTK